MNWKLNMLLKSSANRKRIRLFHIWTLFILFWFSFGCAWLWLAEKFFQKRRWFFFLVFATRLSCKAMCSITPKKHWIESTYGINVSVFYWLMIWATYSFFKSFYSISIYSQPLFNVHSTYRKSWSSQFPTKESSRLSILVPTLLQLQ